MSNLVIDHLELLKAALYVCQAQYNKLHIKNDIFIFSFKLNDRLTLLIDFLSQISTEFMVVV